MTITNLSSDNRSKVIPRQAFRHPPAAGFPLPSPSPRPEKVQLVSCHPDLPKANREERRESRKLRFQLDSVGHFPSTAAPLLIYFF